MGGMRQQPRGKNAVALVPSSSFIAMHTPLITVPARKMNYRFMLAEAAWILSGSNRIDDLGEFAKLWYPFSDDGITTHGAYGPKVMGQIHHVVKTLQYDHDSRQAVMNLWRENPPVTKDVPCTLSLQFIVSPTDTMVTIATMRSSDLWLGYVYDIFTFSMISWAVAAELSYKPCPTTLYINVGNQHLYEKDDDLAIEAERCYGKVYPSPRYDERIVMSQVKSYRSLLEQIRAALRHEVTDIQLFNWINSNGQAKV